MQKNKAPDCFRTMAFSCCAILVLFCVFSAGCVDNFTIPDVNSFSFPKFSESGGSLKAYFLDVGQGDSTLIVFGNTTILIDAGETDKGDIVVGKLRSLGISRINLLVVTHPHSDHIGGMEKVLGAFAIGQVLDSGMPHPSPIYERFLDTIEEKHIRYRIAQQGQTIDLDPALRIVVLSPPGQRNSDDLNDNSIILRISYGTVDLLLTGDAGKGTEEQLEKTGYALDSEILKVAHHGSTHSTGTAFLGRVHPEVAVIHVGAGNQYGHPSEETLAALKNAGVSVYRTDRDGDILVTSDGISYKIQTAYGAVGVPFIPATPVTVSPVKSTTVSTTTTPYDVVISATQFNAPGDDRENLNGEYIRITNRGTGVVSMNGWTLSDRTGARPYIFPAFLLLPDSSVFVYTGTGAINDTALFMGQTAPVWGNNGDEAVLKDDRGNVVDRRSESGGT
ncbi:MAG: lamin tail domain-containing protein [Methanoregula sp.]|nr:MAG: lamin tail domain-containing protein [Methanoregula sp.]